MKEAEIIENWEFVEQKFVEYDDGVITMVDAVRSILDHLESQPNKGQDEAQSDYRAGLEMGLKHGYALHPTDEAQRFAEWVDKRYNLVDGDHMDKITADELLRLWQQSNNE
jgi:hypothetical protein